MTDNVRWLLHKIFLLSPQFALADGLLEIAKNNIQAEVNIINIPIFDHILRISISLLHYNYNIEV
jgi:hypothetical protein